MAIAIKGIRVLSVAIGLDKGETELTSEYALISTGDKILAKQAVGGYGGMKIQPSAATVGALNEFLKLYKADIQTVLGLESE